jgi:hypothetical protein
MFSGLWRSSEDCPNCDASQLNKNALVIRHVVRNLKDLGFVSGVSIAPTASHADWSIII